MADLSDLFTADDVGTQRVLGLLADPNVTDIRINDHSRVFYDDARHGPKMVADSIFPSETAYVRTINKVLQLTDAGIVDLNAATQPYIEASFRSDRTDVRGSVAIATRALTRGEPAVVLRKQPVELVTLDSMLAGGMMSADMRLFLELAVRGRLNMVIAGGSGAGKTTLARALSWYVDPSERIVSVEDVDELVLRDRLPNTVNLFSYVERDERGVTIREETLEDLVRHALRLRGNRIWVGETRGAEAAALVKAALSGHDGCVTTVHANSAAQATQQLVMYALEGHFTEAVAMDQVAAAFHLTVHVARARLGRRVITEIVELEATREDAAGAQRRNVLWAFDFESGEFIRTGTPSPRLRAAMDRHSVNLGELDRLLDAARWANR